MVLRGLNKTTLLDFPGKVAATVFTGGCNFKCAFCQNSDLVFDPASQPELSEEEILDFIKKRQGILEGICITGGEPTLNNDLITFIKKIKTIGTAVKLDTNGYNPEVIKQLLSEKLLDMVAMDIKSKIIGLPQLDFSRIEKSARILMESSIDYEFRTTVVREYFNEETAQNIAKWLSGAEKYFLQKFEDNEKVIEQGLTSPTLDEMLKYKEILSKTIKQVELRGIDY